MRHEIETFATGSTGIREPGSRIETTSSLGEFTIIEAYPFPEVEKGLRGVTLKDNAFPGFNPYRRSSITLEPIAIDQLHPCSLYALKAQLETMEQLRRSSIERNIDILNLTPEQTMIDYQLGDNRFTITPPAVEVSEDDGKIPVITDGLHRVIVAQNLGLTQITVVRIENAAVPLPVLPVSWSEVKLYDEVPPTEQKRRFRFRSMSEIWTWIRQNPERFNQGFDSSYFFYRAL